MDHLSFGSKHTGTGADRKFGFRGPKLKSTITCQCGAQILLVPDLKEMNSSIEAHVKEHKKKDGISDAEAEIILDDLIAQIFGKIS